MPFLFLKIPFSYLLDHYAQQKIRDESDEFRHNPMNYRVFPYLTSCFIAIISLPLQKNSYDDTQRFHGNNPGTNLLGE